MSRIAVVVGSTRPGRITPVLADWLVARPVAGATLEVVDLAAVGLPLLDEPLKPALGGYVHEHTQRWSAQVAAYDAFVFVFPQYNWGYPAPLKNALDTLYAEWAGKPAGFVCHGTRGGGRAAAQLREVTLGLHMAPVDPPLLVSVPADAVDAREQLVDAAATLAPHREQADVLLQAVRQAIGT